MRIIDLSQPIVAGATGFPTDPAIAVTPHATLSTHRFNTSVLTTGTHQGTHLDAMYHFFADGRTIDRMPLEWFFGPARVLRLPRGPGGEIDVDDLAPHAAHFRPGARLLIATGWSRWIGRPEYFTDFPSITVAAARLLVRHGIRLLGLDWPTPGRLWLELHHVFLAPEHEVVLVEGLTNLGSLPDEFVFAAFPLNLAGRDGSPVRAVAICEADETAPAAGRSADA